MLLTFSGPYAVLLVIHLSKSRKDADTKISDKE